MRIGVDLRIIHYARTGFYRYALGVLALLSRCSADREIVLLVHPEFAANHELFGRHELVRSRTPLFQPNEGSLLSTEIEPLDLDVLHFPFSLFPRVTGCGTVLTIHDLTCVRYPQVIEPRYLGYYRKSVEDAPRANKVIADSRQLRRELIDAGVPGQLVECCYPVTPFEQAADRYLHTAARSTPGGGVGPRLQPGGFILCVGSIEPRKNYPTALRAFEQFRNAFATPIALVVAANHGWLTDEFDEAVQESPVKGDIHILPQVDDRLLMWLYDHCAAYLCTSLYEGFGFTPLEALFRGAPLVSTPAPSLTESGYPRGECVDSHDVAGLADRLIDAVRDRERYLRRQAQHVARVRSYYQALKEQRLWDIYRSVGTAD